jgi:xanthine phosphoribosyltransferase
MVVYAAVTWDQVHRDARSLAASLVKQAPYRGIVAVARGGMIPACIVARELECRLIETMCVVSYPDEAGSRTAPVILKAPSAGRCVNCCRGRISHACMPSRKAGNSPIAG